MIMIGGRGISSGETRGSKTSGTQGISISRKVMNRIKGIAMGIVVLGVSFALGAGVAVAFAALTV